MRYRSRGLRRRGESDNWEVTLSHKDPMTVETVNSYHTVQGKTRRAAVENIPFSKEQLEFMLKALEAKMTVPLDKRGNVGGGFGH